MSLAPWPTSTCGKAAAGRRGYLEQGARRHPGARRIGGACRCRSSAGSIFGSGEILYERNELADAWNHLSRGLERAELGGDVRALIAGYLMAGRVKLAQGDIAAAAEYLERARPLVEPAPFPDWTSRFERLPARTLAGAGPAQGRR